MIIKVDDFAGFKEDFSELIRVLANNFLEKGTDAIKVNSYKITFITATINVELLKGFSENVDVYGIEGMDKNMIDKMTRLLVNVDGLFERPVRIGIYKNYIAVYPYDDKSIADKSIVTSFLYNIKNQEGQQ